MRELRLPAFFFVSATLPVRSKSFGFGGRIELLCVKIGGTVLTERRRCSWKVQSPKALWLLTFGGFGFRMILKMGGVYSLIEDGLGWRQLRDG